MICKGRSRSDGGQLVSYLLSYEKNLLVEVIDERGFDMGAGLRAGIRLAEVEAEQARQGKKALYHGIIAPAAGEKLTRDQQMAAVEILERKLGFEGLKRVVVVHRAKDGGEEHVHIAWSRFDSETGKLRRDSFTKRKNVEANLEISDRFGFDPLRDPFANDLDRDDRTQRRQQSKAAPTQAEYQQDERAAKGRAERQAEISGLWESTDSGQALHAALTDAGYTLARGDRGFVVVDVAGEVHSLARQAGVKKAEIDARLRDVNPALIPEVDTITAGMKQARQDRAREGHQADEILSQTTDGATITSLRSPDADEDSTAAGKMDAAAILAELTRHHSTFTRQDLARLVDKATGGGGRELWMVQTGGFDQLNADHKDSAKRSYETWAAENPRAAARYGLENYVAYVQERHEERNGEQPGVREAQASTRGAFEKLLGEVEASADLIALGPDRSGRDRFTSRAMLEIELRMDDAAADLAGRGGHAVKETHQASALASAEARGQKLGDEQGQAFTHVTAAGDLKLVVGFAGTGKSTMLGAAREALEAQGFRVRGTAVSGIAADSLEKGAGIRSRTLHSLLHQLDTIEARGAAVKAFDAQIAEVKGRSQKANRFRGDLVAKRGRMAADVEAASLTKRDVLVVDEAGMIGSRQMERLLTEAQKAGAKVILVGDAEQLQAIDAGAAFRSIQDRHGAAEITEVRRQRVDWQRDATRDLATAQTADALARYQAAGMVHQADTVDQAKAELVTAWSQARQENPAGSQIILAYTRKDVADLNLKARAAYREEGRLGQDFSLKTEAGQRDFAAGDRLYFTKNDTRLAVRNGSLGTVEGIDGNMVSVRLDTAPGEAVRSVAFDIRDYGHITHGYAATVHKSQGVTVDRAHVLASRYMDRHAAYVGMSRHRDQADLYYGTTEFKDFDRMARRLSRDAGKDTTLDYIVRAERGQGYTEGLRGAVADFWQRVKSLFQRPAWLDQAEAQAESRDREKDRDREKGKDRGTIAPTPSNRAEQIRLAAKKRNVDNSKVEHGNRASAIMRARLEQMTQPERDAFEKRQAQQEAAMQLRQQLEATRRRDGPKNDI